MGVTKGRILHVAKNNHFGSKVNLEEHAYRNDGGAGGWEFGQKYRDRVAQGQKSRTSIWVILRLSSRAFYRFTPKYSRLPSVRYRKQAGG